MGAASSNHDRIVPLLLASGADVKGKDMYGRTALMEAASSDHDGIVRLLLASEADVKGKEYGLTALRMASQMASSRDHTQRPRRQRKRKLSDL